MSTQQSETPPPTCSPGVLSGPCREKYWTELDDAGKIARLHEVVKRLMRQLTDASKQGRDAHIVAESHQHAADGTVMMPVDSFNRDQSGQLGGNRDERYF